MRQIQERDLNLGPPDYKSNALTTSPPRLIERAERDDHQRRGNHQRRAIIREGSSSVRGDHLREAINCEGRSTVRGDQL